LPIALNDKTKPFPLRKGLFICLKFILPED